MTLTEYCLLDFDNLTSASPPNKPNFRRKQSDDAFVIHKVSTSPIKKPLTPTNNHPLQNSEEVRHEKHEEDDHDDYFYEQKTAKNDENRNKVNYMMLNNKNNINLNNNKNDIMEQIDDNQNDSDTTMTKPAEATHETGTGIVTKELEPDQVVRRQKKVANNASNATQKSNQRASFPMITKTNYKPTTVENPGFECSDIEKLEGEIVCEIVKKKLSYLRQKFVHI